MWSVLPDFPPLLSREFLQEFLRRDLGTQFNQSYLLLSLLPSCLCLFYLMWSGTLRVGLSNENNPFLKVLLLAAFKPQLYFFSLCPTSGQADKEARFFLLWHQWEIRRMQVPCQAQILIPGPPLTTIKTQTSHLSWFSQAVLDLLERAALLSLEISVT